MSKSLQEIIRTATGATTVSEIGKLQDLWSGYGTIKRYRLEDCQPSTIIVKHVRPPRRQDHPRGWNSSISHQRKLKSYQVESTWYRDWSRLCGNACRVPQVFTLENIDGDTLIVMEDLDSSGFPERKASVDSRQLRACVKWLAHFHATFLGKEPLGLWDIGTYWHLDTRPEELQALHDRDLKHAAAAIDRKLNQCEFKTFVHGDAKLANFCFSKDGKRVAAVDFQYVGGGCGMKDLAYFIGSCLREEECEEQEKDILSYYFQILESVINAKHHEVNIGALREEWEQLFPFAWADFHRFLKGWSPGHWKINSYSERITRKVLENL